MTPKISLNEFLISVLPGGSVLAVLLSIKIFTNSNFLEPFKNLDFLSIFIFLTLAFIIGEVLQIIAHLCEKIIDLLFFKGYRPSDVFLLPGNPVLGSEYIRSDLIERFNLSIDQKKELNKYKNIPFAIFKNKNKFVDLNKKFFWKIYTQVKSDENIKDSNARYLFSRVMFVVFVIFSALFWKFNFLQLFYGSIVLSLLFLWRARGCARGLVFAAVNKYLAS